MPFEFSDPTERTDDMQATNGVKEEARQLVERLPDTATWDDLMEEIYVRQAVERTRPSDGIAQRFTRGWVSSAGTFSEAVRD